MGLPALFRIGVLIKTHNHDVLQFPLIRISLNGEVSGMKKRIIIVSLIFAVLAILAILALPRNKVPSDIREMYADFMENFSHGEYKDIDPFLHYEIPECRTLSEECFTNVAEYKIKSWKKLNDDLWMATLYIRTDNEEKGSTGYHFIGKLGDTWKIMIGPYQVPESLSKGLDLSGDRKSVV